MRRLIDPQWRSRNKRGQMLLIFGLIWVSIGFSVLDQPYESGQQDLLFTNIPVMVRAMSWIVTGMIGVAYSIRPLHRRSDDLGFFALYLMPAERVFIFALGYIDYWVPELTIGPLSLFGTEGYSRGLYRALVWVVILCAVIVCSRWPDPPADIRGQL